MFSLKRMFPRVMSECSNPDLRTISVYLRIRLLLVLFSALGHPS